MTDRGALAVAHTIDPSACSMGPEAPDCLLVNAEHAATILRLLPPSSYEDPNVPPTPWTRLLVGDGSDR